MRQAHGLGDRFVENAHAEVLLHQRRHAAQHRGRQRLARLLDLHDLEAPRQRRILLEVLLVFAPGGGGDRAQLAARQRRLEQVGRIVLAGLAARADHGVRLVDEQDDRVRALLHLVDHVLQAVLELALHARAGLQQPHVEHVQRDAQRRRHVVRGDAQRQPSTTAVLPTPASPVRIGLFWRRRIRMSMAWRISASRPITGSILPSRALREVRGELSSAGVFDGPAAARPAPRRTPHRRRRHRLARLGFARAGHDLVELVLQVGHVHFRELRGHPLRELREIGRGQQRQQQMARADPAELRIERRDQPGLLEQRDQMHGEHRRARVARLQPREFALEIGTQRMRIDAARAQRERQIARRLVEQRDEQVLQIDLVMAARQARARRAFGRVPAQRVQFRDQGLQGRAHGVDLRFDCLFVVSQ
jgi:hypothetical protein